MGDDDKTKIVFQRPPGLDDAQPPPPRQPQQQAPPRPSIQRPPAQAAAQQAEAISWDSTRLAGESAMLAAAKPLLILAGRLRHTMSHADPHALQRHCVEQVQHFEAACNAAGYTPQQISAARYGLCTLIDEAVMKTPWGANSGWNQQSLLMRFHRETWGGEKFFQILERTLQQPGEFRDLIEVYYACLAQGLVGRFGVETGGGAQLSDIQDRAYRVLLANAPSPDPELSPHWRGVKETGRVLKMVPMWLVSVVALVVVIGAFLWMRSLLGSASQPVAGELATIGLEPYQPPRRVVRASDAVPVAQPVPAGPSLPELLEAPASQGLLTLETKDNKTIIVVSHADLFASARSNVNPKYAQLWTDIANALNRVPGRVLVVGHTDDLPLRSLAYKDNFELSRERAKSVTELLRPQLNNPGRLEFTGVGPSQPRYLPVNLKENRARNRRVELTHWAAQS